HAPAHAPAVVVAAASDMHEERAKLSLEFEQSLLRRPPALAPDLTPPWPRNGERQHSSTAPRSEAGREATREAGGRLERREDRRNDEHADPAVDGSTRGGQGR